MWLLKDEQIRNAISLWQTHPHDVVGRALSLAQLRHIVSKLEEIGFDSVAQETFSISYKDWNELKEESK